MESARFRRRGRAQPSRTCACSLPNSSAIARAQLKTPVSWRCDGIIGGVSSLDREIADAIALHAAGRFIDACAAYEGLLRRWADQPEILSNLADVLRRLGRLDEAERRAREALALRPGFAEARHNLSLVLEAQGRLREAI